MEKSQEKITSRIIRDMNEGIITVGNDGKIILTNPRAAEILGKSAEELEGCPLALAFYEDSRNDDFNQTLLEAVYDSTNSHSSVVPYYVNNCKKYINIITSCMKEGEKAAGIVAVLSDITELVEVREHLKLMQQIEALNASLEERNAFIRKAFSSYLSDEIVEQILDKPDGLKAGGQLENITVVMSDLRGFTALCQKVSPEELIKMLNHYLDCMTHIIRSHGGTIIEYVGDGILAIFGGPVKTEDHPVQAVAASLEMQQEMQKINAWNRENGFPELKLGIGVNTGDAIVGNLGSEFAMKYNVIGPSINLCGRIESCSVDGQLFISPYTRERVHCEIEIDTELEIRPKGMKESITIYSVCGLGAPYNIRVQHKIDCLTPLSSPVKTTALLLNEKIAGDAFDVTVFAASEESAEIGTESSLSMLDNLILRYNGELYCKVTGENNGRYILTITARQ